MSWLTDWEWWLFLIFIFAFFLPGADTETDVLFRDELNEMMRVVVSFNIGFFTAPFIVLSGEI